MALHVPNTAVVVASCAASSLFAAVSSVLRTDRQTVQWATLARVGNIIFRSHRLVFGLGKLRTGWPLPCVLNSCL
jgi:hypothetical protein